MLPSIFAEDLFDDFFRDPFGAWDRFERPMRRALPDSRRAQTPVGGLMRTDVRETESGYELNIDLPGFGRDDVTVDLKNGYLTVSAAKTENNEEKDENGRFLRRERFAGSCSRSFYVGEVRPEEVNARYDSGVLTLTVPKEDTREVPESSRIAIE